MARRSTTASAANTAAPITILYDSGTPATRNPVPASEAAAKMAVAPTMNDAAKTASTRARNARLHEDPFTKGPRVP